MSILGDLLVTNVSFGQDGIRIEYLEQRTQTDIGGVEHALVLFKLNEDEIALITEMQAALSDMVDNYYENLPDRNRPDTLPQNRFQRISEPSLDSEAPAAD